VVDSPGGPCLDASESAHRLEKEAITVKSLPFPNAFRITNYDNACTALPFVKRERAENKYSPHVGSKQLKKQALKNGTR
jgi:hypothetical protein